MSRSVHRFLRLLGAVAAGYAAMPLALFAVYWGGLFVIGDIPSDAVVQWVVGATFLVMAVLVLWKTRPAPRSARPPAKRRLAALASPEPARAVDAPPRA